MAFTGVAIYDIFANEVGEDVSDIVSLISPSRTKFLDDVGDADTPVTSKVYSWEEKALLPDTYSNSSAIASNAGAAIGIEVGANAAYLRVNDILRNQEAGNEMMKVVSIGTSAATIYVQRAYAGTSANSSAAGITLDFLGSALEEGAGTRDQRRVGRTLKSNFVQVFREDINLSTLTTNTVFKAKGQPDPFEEEKVDKTTEVLKQLEKAVLMGRTNGNTIGADDTETTLAGIYHSIATNITSHATFSNSILNNMLAQIDSSTDLEGNHEKYALYAGRTAFRKVSNNRSGRIQETMQETTSGVKKVTNYESDFGPMPISYIRWLPAGSVLALRKDFVKVRPFAGNSFQFKEFDNGNLAKEGYIAGTYGLEFHQEAAHGRLDGIA
jgi:hypothetical protein